MLPKLKLGVSEVTCSYNNAGISNLTTYDQTPITLAVNE